MHRIDCDCWTLDVRLKNFIPTGNWEQAGILLMEDTGFGRASVRVSIAFTDYNGVYPCSETFLYKGLPSGVSGKTNRKSLRTLFYCRRAV